MAKAPKKLVNFRLPLEIIFSIQGMAEVMAVSQSDVIEQAVVLLESQHTQPVSESRSPVAAIQSPSELQAMIDAKQGHESSLPKTASCQHCGNRFVGPKYSTLCGSCSGAGHSGDPRSCGPCTEGQSI